MRISLLNKKNNNNNSASMSGTPDRISQTLFGKFGEEKRWDALNALSTPSQDNWHQRLLLWMLASDHSDMRDRTWEILDGLELDFDLLVNELSCPMWQVRVGVIRLLAKSGRLDIVRLLISGIEDYHQNVIEETKHSLNLLIDRAKERQQRGELDLDEVEDAMTALFRPLYASKRSPRFQVIQFLFKLAFLNENLFWEKYLNLDLPQYTILHDEFIRHQKEGSYELLYRGFLQTDDECLDRLTNFAAVAVRNSGENISYHLNALKVLNRNEFVKVAFALQHYRILVEMQGLIKKMDPPERIILFDLLEVVGAEQNLAFLLRCLQLDDSRIRIRVLKILGESESLGLRNEVFEFLTETDEQVLLATLRYLQKKGDLSILEKIAHLTRSKKPKVRQGVISTMFKIMKDDLLRKFDKLVPGKRNKIVGSLIKMKPSFFEEIYYLSESSEENDRIKYLKILDNQLLSNALDDYRRMAKDKNPKVRATALKGFARVTNDEMRFKLIRRFFTDPNPRVRANAIELLPDFHPENEDMIRIAKRAFNSENMREKCNAIAKLINWGYKNYKKELEKLINSDEQWTKTSALWVVGVVNNTNMIEKLREAANDSRSSVREMAVRGIGKKGTEEDLRALMPFLQDPERKVRLAAQQAIRNRLHLSFEVA